MPANTTARGLIGGLLGAGTILCSVAACAPPEPEPAYVIELEPDEDWALSPYTGWTRAHHEAFFGRLLLGFTSHLSEHGGRTLYPGGESFPASMEGISRMLPAIGGWLADPDNASRVVVDGVEIDLVALSKRALLAATDPDGPDYWSALEPAWDQKKVEAAFVAEFLVRTQGRVWAAMSESERERIMHWLAPTDEALPGNWGLFLATHNVARDALGYEAPLSAAFDRVHEMEGDYAGDGWYFDSNPYRFDFYNAFIIHPSLDFLAGELDDADLETRTRSRVRAYLSHLPYFSSADGAPVAFGRSLAYRTALAAPIIAAEEGDYSPLSSGLSRRLVSGQLRFFMGGNPNSTDAMLDEQHVMTRGWRGQDPRLVESYIRPGSQYLAARVAQALALPRDHAFWTSPEQPGPADLGAFVHAVPTPGWVLVGSEDGHQVTMLNAGSNSDRASGYGPYKRLLYSSSFGFDQATDGRLPYDAQVVPAGDLSFTSPRSEPTDVEIGPGMAYVAYVVSDELEVQVSEIRTLAFEHGGHLVRTSCVGAHGSDPVTVYEAGFAVPTTSMSTGQNPAPWARLESERGSTLLVGLDGFGSVGEQLGFEGRSDLNALDEATTFPTLVSAPDRRCFVSVLAVSSAPTSIETLADQLPTVSWDADLDAVNLLFPDGTAVFADLSPTPSPSSRALGEAQATGATRFARFRADPLTLELVGADGLDDDQGALVTLDGDDRRLACTREPQGLRCETATGFTLHPASPPTSVLLHAVDGTSTDLSATALSQDAVVLPDDSIRAHALANEITLVRVDIR